MEMMDVVDDNNNVIRQVSRKEIYEKELSHRIVHVLAYNSKGKVALQQSGEEKNFCPLHWGTTAGGHVEAGESYLEAAKRELEEEVGITGNLEKIFEFEFEKRGLKKFICVFRMNYSGKFKVNKEVKQVRYFSPDEIREMQRRKEKFHPELEYILENYVFR